MKTLLVSIFLLIINIYAETISQSEYIQKADSGNLEAIIELNNTYPYFLRTKTGRNAYERWYQTILESNDANTLSKFIKIYNTYEDYFVNQEKKIKTLYELKSKVGTLDDTVELLIKYTYENKYKYSKLYKKNEKKFNINQLLKLSKESYYFGDNANLELKRRNYKPQLDLAAQLKELSYNDKKAFENLKAKIMKQNNVNDLNTLAQYFDKNREDKKAIEIYLKVLTIEDKNPVALEGLAQAYFYARESLEDTDKSVKYAKLAIEYHQSIPSMLILLKMYQIDIKYLDLFPYAVNQLTKSTQGKEKLLQFYYKVEMYDYANQLAEELASEGDLDVMISLIGNSSKVDRYGTSQTFNHDIQGRREYWVNQILNSKNKNLINKMYESYLKDDYDFSRNPKAYEKFALDNEDIIALRKLYELSKYGNNEKFFRQNLLQMYDIKSVLEIADDFIRYAKTKDDAMRGVQLYEELLKIGEIKAYVALAKLYERNSKFIKEDMKKSVSYYAKAADLGDKESLDHLNYYFFRKSNLSTEQVKDVIKWLKKGIELEDEDAIFKLAYTYDDGKIVKQDYKKAAYYYNLIKDINSYASNNLGILYENGNGVKKDLDLAFKCYTTSSNIGNSYADYNLGRFYEDGLEPVKKDIKKAIFYYQKAKNNHYAKERLNVLFKNTKGK